MSEVTDAVETQHGDDLLAELSEEFLRRYRAGEHPSVDEYADKHPELAQRIRDLFPAVVLMEQPGATVDLAPPVERIGATIGRYKLLERIGEGGFGVVYMAEQQQPLRRKVALKVIKPGVDTRQVIARFEAERQALALMDHESIAKVLDAGATDSGRPYFVMELVHGLPITEFCDKNQLAPRDRLELFVQVCRAVQHAHTKGIIHRDIKPTNVLVTLHEGVPVPKVIDFGVAKATGQQLTEKTLFTNFAQMVGTPLYMSPEQAEMTGVDVDTRSDVYSLGVLLYELLTGTTPLDKDRLKQAAFDEVRRIIREEEPQRPSTRLSTMGEQARSISARARGKSDAKQLGQLICGELDWIVMKALEKERARRYETASGLGRDIEHYLRDETVEACPPSASYRLRKLVRRYRLAIGIAIGFLVTLTLASIASTWQAVRATRAEQQVIQQRDQVQVALVEKQDALAQAMRSERTSRERLATQLIAVGDAALASGRSPARDSYYEAWDVLRELGKSELPVATGLLASYAQQPPPLMGSDGRRAGVGGFEGHTRSPTIAFMADGRRAVSASFDGSIIVWDAARGAVLRRSPGVGQNTNEMALSPDQRQVLTADNDKLVRLWDLATGDVIQTFKGHTEEVRAVAFSPDGKRAISSDVDDATVRLWDVDSGAELRRMKAPGPVYGVAFLPDGRRAVSCGEPDVTVLWDVESGRAVHTMSEGSGSAVLALSLSPDGRTALSGGMSFRMTLWDLDSGTAVRTFSGHASSIRCVAFSPDGRLAVSGSDDRSVRLWEVSTARQLGIWHGHVGRVSSIGFSPDGRMALSADTNGAIKLWDVREQQETPEFRGHDERVISLSVSDGGAVLSGSFDKTARLWDDATGLPMLTLATGDSPIWGVALSSNLRSALSAQEDGTVSLWDLSTASRVRSLGKHDDVATCVAFSPDDRLALSSSSDKSLKLWNVKTGNLVRTFTGHSGKVRAVAFAPDGQTALSASFDRTLKLWDVNTGQVLRTFAGHRHWVHSVAFAPDGRRAASGGWDSQWGLWDVASGDNLQFNRWDPAVVTGVAFSPDEKLLVTGSIEGRLGLWDLSDGVHVRDLQRQHASSPAPTMTPASYQSQGITSVAFCRDGATVLAGSREGTIQRWQLDRPARFDEFAKSLPRAREALAIDPADGNALATFGRWYAFRGVYDWAAEFLEKARDRGGDVSSLELARCYWQLDRRTDAAREFTAAIRKNEGPRDYLELCRSASQKRPLPERDSVPPGRSVLDVPAGVQSPE